MAVDDFNLKLYTPAGLQREERVEWITLPSVNGEIGVLPHHTKYTGLLGIGVMSYLAQGASQATRLVISGGFCTFSGNTFVILADSVDFAESVNRTTYDTERDALSKVVDTSSTFTGEWQQAQEKLQRIGAIDKLIDSDKAQR